MSPSNTMPGTVRAVSPESARVTSKSYVPAGTTVESDEAEYESAADEVHFHEIGPNDHVVHDLENVGETTVRFTTVELLD